MIPNSCRGNFLSVNKINIDCVLLLSLQNKQMKLNFRLDGNEAGSKLNEAQESSKRFKLIVLI